MKAVVFSQIGNTEVLTYTRVYTPKPARDEALVKVLYCGINHLDILIRQGKRPVPQVFFAVTLAGNTAHHLIERAGLKEKSTVLVTGATGGVGTALIELLEQKQCTIIAATSDEKKKKELEALGIHHVVSTKTMVEDIAKLFPQGINYVFDLVGGNVWSNALKTLGKNGTITFCATSLEENGEVEIGKTFVKQLNILGSYGGSKKDLQAIIKLVENGKLKPVINNILPLEEAIKAHEIIENQNVFGKVLLKVRE